MGIVRSECVCKMVRAEGLCPSSVKTLPFISFGLLVEWYNERNFTGRHLKRTSETI